MSRAMIASATLMLSWSPLSALPPALLIRVTRSIPWLLDVSMALLQNPGLASSGSLPARSRHRLFCKKSAMMALQAALPSREADLQAKAAQSAQDSAVSLSYGPGWPAWSTLR